MDGTMRERLSALNTAHLRDAKIDHAAPSKLDKERRHTQGFHLPSRVESFYADVCCALSVDFHFLSGFS